MNLPPITCEVCGHQGRYGDAGWRLAPNKIGAYTCGPECDRVFSEAQKAAKLSSSPTPP